MSDSSSDKKFKIRLEMKSDWHIGTGTGIPGSVDALLARDGDGFPCVPAKTIVGIWRDALETLTYGLDSGVVKGKWQSWVAVIFGSQPNIDKIPTDKPRPSILSIQPARLDENLRAAIKGEAQLEQALTFIKPNTRIDSASGTAETDSLRFTEMGRIGTVLETEFKLEFEGISEDRKKLVEALLVASASLIERIGGNRRRGSGKCEMQVVGGVSIEEAVEVLRNNLESVPPAVAGGLASDEDIVDAAQNSTTPLNHSTKQIADNNDPPESIPTSDWKKIKYSLKLHTPVAIVTNTLGNVSETLDFIPGTYLLPHITKQLKGPPKYVAAGDFQILPATIEVNGERGLPVPKVFLQEKMNESKVYSRLQKPEESLTAKTQAKPIREGFISMDKGNFTHVKTPRILLMHNTVDDPVQRPTENVGGIFSRQAIKAGTVLRGEIRFNKSIENKVKSLENYESYVRIGTSKKDDYGLAELTFETLEDDTSNATADNKLIVYLESDVLLRNSNLRQTNLVDELKVFFEKELSVSLQKKEEDSLIQVRRIESWHEGWGFPRPTLTAMAAGSVVIFTIEKFDNFTDDEKLALQTNLQKFEVEGIGERRGEGYGQIRFNPPILTSGINSWSLSKKTKQATNGNKEAIEKLKAEINHTEKLKEFISIIELSAWRDELARAVLKLANEPQKCEEIFGFKIQAKESIPSLNQIGGLRSVIARLKLDGANKNIVTEWLKHLKDTSNRADKWKAGFGEIENLFADGKENLVWEKLNGFWKTPKILISDETTLKTQLWAEAVKSLFDACARAHKRDTEDN